MNRQQSTPQALVLTTDRLILSPPTPMDAPFVLALLNDPGWIRYIGDRRIRTLEGAKTYISEKLKPGPWFIARTAVGTSIGLVGMVHGRPGLEDPDLGYAVLENHAGCGYATEMARAVLDHACSVLGFRRIAAITSREHPASQRVLSKLGFRVHRVTALAGGGGEVAVFLFDS